MSFGYSYSVSGKVLKCTPQLFHRALDNKNTSKVCADIKEALEKVKRGEMSREDFDKYKNARKKELDIFTPHATFRSGERKNKMAIPSGLSMYDIDHIPDPRGYYKAMIAERVGELGVVLAHVTPSTEGLRLLFVMPEGMTLAEAQKWMSEQLGDENYDGGVKDMARASYAVPRSYLLYLDEEELFMEREIKTEENVKDDVRHQPSPLPMEGTGVASGAAFKGIPYSEIIREWWNRNGGVPAEGERNVKLHKLAVNLRAICDNKKEILLSVMPRMGLDESELRSIVHSACKEPPKGISKMMQRIVDTLTQEDAEEADNEESNCQLSTINSQLRKSLPIGLKESLVGVPDNMKMPVLCSIMPIAAAYADQVEVKYCDGNHQHLGLMSIILGEQASGKSVCKHAVDLWKRQFDEEDALARKREEEWKERKKARKSNEKAPDDPKVLIRALPVTVSCSTLLKRFKNANGHTLYSFGEELDTLRKTNGAGSWSSKYDIYRLSFDRGEWGQDYNSDQAESGTVKVAYNWTILGTYGAMRKCFKSDNIENGLSSRILVAEMPDCSFSKMPKFKKRSKEDEARIQEAVTKLRGVSGFIDTPRLRKAIENWVEEKRVEAAKDIDHVKDTYRRRAAVIGFRCGVIFRLLEGKESNAAIEFALMMAEYCLKEQIKTFGDSLLNEYVNAKDECQRYGANHSVFDQLPPTFTKDDLRALKSGYCSDNSLYSIISRWKNDGWLEKIGKNKWKKQDTSNS